MKQPVLYVNMRLWLDTKSMVVCRIHLPRRHGIKAIPIGVVVEE